MGLSGLVAWYSMVSLGVVGGYRLKRSTLSHSLVVLRQALRRWMRERGKRRWCSTALVVRD